MAIKAMRGLPVVVRTTLASAALIAAALPAAAPAQRGAAARQQSSWSETIVELHNRERALVGARPLSWDPTLAAAAAAYAPQLARLARLDHSPRSTRRGQGENLWRGSRGAYAVGAVIAAWAGEKRLFRAGIFPNVSSSGDSYDVNHYSQMIWPTTTSVGCAFHRANRYDYLVCRYSPRGNVDGQRVP
jgi:hypothetical protein